MTISKDNLRLALAVLYTLQLITMALVATHSPFVAVNITQFILLNSIIHFAFGFYLFNLQNVAGWWRKQWFLARERANYRNAIKERYERETGMGYHKLK